MNTALILIDIQNDYFENGAMKLRGSEAACQNAKRILNKFRADDMPLIHIQHIANKPNATFFLPNTIGAEINKELKPLPNEKIIIKHSPNGFKNTELLEYLNSLNINDLVICGMMTHMCVDATTRAAKDYVFNCILIGDACATKDLEINGIVVKAEYVQNSFLSALNYFYSSVKTTNQYLNQTNID